MKLKAKLLLLPCLIISVLFSMVGNSQAGEHLKTAFLPEDVSGAWRLTLKSFREL